MISLRLAGTGHDMDQAGLPAPALRIASQA
jgi:hypothetical protein